MSLIDVNCSRRVSSPAIFASLVLYARGDGGIEARQPRRLARDFARRVGKRHREHIGPILEMRFVAAFLLVEGFHRRKIGGWDNVIKRLRSRQDHEACDLEHVLRHLGTVQGFGTFDNDGRCLVERGLHGRDVVRARAGRSHARCRRDKTALRHWAVRSSRRGRDCSGSHRPRRARPRRPRDRSCAFRREDPCRCRPAPRHRPVLRGKAVRREWQRGISSGSRMRLHILLEQMRAIDLGIDLRGRKTGMAEQFLDGAKIGAIAQEMRGE